MLDDKIHVATTRIETMLGDTAICVHPEDERFTVMRYLMYHGSALIVLRNTMANSLSILSRVDEFRSFRILW